MDQTTLVKRTLELTEAIHHAAHLADWPRAAELSAERLPLLQSIDVAQSPEALAMVRRIQALDEDLLAHGSAWKTGLQDEFRVARERSQAARAYQAAARL